MGGIYFHIIWFFLLKLIDIFDNRAAASAALGIQGHRHALKVGSRDQADRAFANQYKRGDIDEIVDLIALEALEANGTWACYDLILYVWYLVLC